MFYVKQSEFYFIGLYSFVYNMANQSIENEFALTNKEKSQLVLITVFMVMTNVTSSTRSEKPIIDLQFVY